MKSKLLCLSGLFGLAVTLSPVSGQDTPAVQEEKKNAAITQAELLQAVRQQPVLEAAATLEKAIAEAPNIPTYQDLRLTIATRAVTDGNKDLAIEQVDKLLEFQYANTDNDLMVQRIAGASSMVNSIYLRAAATEKATAAMEKVGKLLDEKNTPEIKLSLLPALVQFTGQRAMLAAQNGDQDGALAGIRTRQEAVSRLTENPEANEAAVVALSRLIGMESQIVRRNTPAEADALATKQEQLLLAALEKNPESLGIVQEIVSARSSVISTIVRDDPERAQALVNDTTELLKKHFSENDVLLKNMITRLAGFERTIASAMIVKKMIGQPAPALDIEAVAHGGPVSPGDLQGKVVMLDFWAVWCGPCIATFPHLKEWQEEFGDKGFQIVGVTRHYGYTWNEETSRATKSTEEVSAEDELAMIDKFMTHHGLLHPTIVTPKESVMQKEYAVTGIPHAVLIDRKGNVRMIKIGSGPANATALHEMIQQLVAE